MRFRQPPPPHRSAVLFACSNRHTGVRGPAQPPRARTRRVGGPCRRPSHSLRLKLVTVREKHQLNLPECTELPPAADLRGRLKRKAPRPPPPPQGPVETNVGWTHTSQSNMRATDRPPDSGQRGPGPFSPGRRLPAPVGSGYFLDVSDRAEGPAQRAQLPSGDPS